MLIVPTRVLLSFLTVWDFHADATVFKARRVLTKKVASLKWQETAITTAAIGATSLAQRQLAGSGLHRRKTKRGDRNVCLINCAAPASALIRMDACDEAHEAAVQ